jgi:Kef-type K+ transport system membrane component KefB
MPERRLFVLTGQILFQLIIILIVVQIFGYLCSRVGQQWVIGEILAGLVLGPSLLGAFWPGLQKQIFPALTLPTLQVLGDMGLVLYMFSLGARLDIHLMMLQSRKAVVVSIGGILLPLLMGMALAFFLYHGFARPQVSQISFMLMVGTVMAITAFPVLARFLGEKNMLGTRMGSLALTCAAFGDVCAWCLLALVIAIARAQSLLSVVLTIGFLLLFAACVLLVVRPLLALADRHMPSTPLLVALSVILLLFAAWITNALGIHPVFGAFMMGFALPRKARFIELVRSMDQVNTILFLPLYFVYSGLHTQVGLINGVWLWLLCLLILVTACTGKILGGMFSMRLMGETWRDSLSLGVLMNTRGLVELIVLNIGLQLGILSPTLFSMLLIMALVTTMMASPLLWLQGYRQKSYRSSTAGEGEAVQSLVPLQEEIS